MGYSVKVLADSISPAGHRITSFEATFPRIVLAEVNTHCMLARNSASSRAIPVQKRITAVNSDPFVPESFGRNQKGMQPGEELEGKERELAQLHWDSAKEAAVGRADALAELGVHKQYANRLLEPFSWHTAVITATDWENFFHLRVNPMAQGEFRKVAEMMQEARENSKPRMLTEWWHTPYVDPDEAFYLIEVQKIDVAAVSAARCARVSYLTQDGKRDVSEDLALYARLVEAGHLSPLEHVARPMTQPELDLVEAWDVAVDEGPVLRWPTGAMFGANYGVTVGRKLATTNTLVEGKGGTVTFARGPLFYSGKLNGWISRRTHVPGEHDILGHRAQERKCEICGAPIPNDGGVAACGRCIAGHYDSNVVAILDRLEGVTGGSPYMAAAALEIAQAVILDSTVHASPEEIEQIHREFETIRRIARENWKRKG